jgi:hypothetical protein
MQKPILISVGSEPSPQQLYYYTEDKRFVMQDVNVSNPHVKAFFNNNPNTIQEIPRRNIVTNHTKAEATIHKAIKDVEYLGASPELTAITMKLIEAFNMLADHVDEALLRIAEKEQ